MKLVAGHHLAKGVMLGVVTALVLAVSAPAAGTGAKLSLRVKPRNPAASSVYKLKVKGKALPGGTFGPKHNRSELQVFGQFGANGNGGKCAPDAPSEYYAGGYLITSRFEKAGKFKFSLKRTATSTRHVTLRFCGYLERTKVAPDKTATTTYTTK